VICVSCGRENPASAKFFNECGQPISPRCHACGAEQPRHAKFCNECGAPLRGSELVSRASSTPTPVLRATSNEPSLLHSQHLADKILQSKSALEGERKQVTVLFADVKGSMELAEQLDPEAWHAILDKFFAILTEGVHRFEGTVNQYTGDGIKALFGVPALGRRHGARFPAGRRDCFCVGLLDHQAVKK